MARQWDVQYVNFYTAGSAAVKYDPKPAPKKQEAVLPKPRKKKKILVYVNPVAVAGICMAIVMMIMMISGVSRLTRAKQQQIQMQNYVQQLQQENERLQAEYEAGYDADEVKEIATAMGMIPAEQAQSIHISVSAPTEEAKPGVWESFRTFLAGLFA